jgi:hypothetical protein
MTEEETKQFGGKMLSIKINGHMFCLGYAIVESNNKIADIVITTSPIGEEKKNN